MKNKIKKVKIFKLIILIIVIAIIVYNTIYLFPIMKQIATKEGQELFKEKITNAGIAGFLTLISLQIAQIFLAILPGEPLEILAGMCYGDIGGTIFILSSVFISTITIYYLVRKFGKKLIYEFFNKEKIDKIEKSKIFNNPKKIEIILFILFFIPGTPKDLLVYIGGILPIKAHRFILIATFARIPSIVSSTFAGSNIIKGDFKSILFIYIITFGLAIGTFFIVNILDKNKETKKAFIEIK